MFPEPQLTSYKWMRTLLQLSFHLALIVMDSILVSNGNRWAVKVTLFSSQNDSLGGKNEIIELSDTENVSTIRTDKPDY